MVKLRLLPVLLTFCCSAAVVFGGWFAYQHYFVKQPLDGKIAAVPGVREAAVDIDRREVRIDLRLEHDADLREVYTAVWRTAKSAAGSRNVRIDLEQNTSETLDALWAQALFDVAEAMEHRRYGDIPDRLNELAAAGEDVTVSTEMDETNVYIRLSDGENSKFVVLPRTPAVMEVWTHDSL